MVLFDRTPVPLPVLARLEPHHPKLGFGVSGKQTNGIFGEGGPVNDGTGDAAVDEPRIFSLSVVPSQWLCTHNL